TDGGANIVTNATFETGSAGWTAAFGGGTVGVSTTFAHCGTQSGELSDRTANYSIISYPLPGPGTYNVALWLAHDAQVDGGGATIQMTAQAAANCPEADGGTTQSFFNAAFPILAANTWTFVSGSLTVPAGCTGAIFYVGQNNSDAVTGALQAPYPDLFIDDVYIAPQ
ncbi:MAG TPA: carbohydrate binding domain-containing protein, partial [Polyangiaceae bacterium]|nr:carbohydrate binding domain-containing protein [Polyangiaceae bacterium]